MKVKVKKIPASVRKQGKEETFSWVVQTFGECFNKYCANRNYLIKPQSRNNSTFSDNDIEELCRNYKLIRIPLDMLSEMILENLYVENGKSFALVPLLWMLNYIS